MSHDATSMLQLSLTKQGCSWTYYGYIMHDGIDCVDNSLYQTKPILADMN